MPRLPQSAELHEQDFHAWTQLQARELRALRRDLERQLPQLYRRAAGRLVRMLRVHGEAGAAEAPPPKCPYSLEQVLGDWRPPDSANPECRP